MAFVTIELRSDHGNGEPLILQLPVPDYDPPVLDKPYPDMKPLPACKLILYHSCSTGLSHRFNNSLFHAHADTLEQACFDAIEETPYDGLDDRQNFKKVRRKHRKEDVIGLTTDNQLIWLQIKTNKMREVPRVMEKWTIPDDAKYIYIGSVEEPSPAFLSRFLFDADEVRLHQRLLRMAKGEETFEFTKISTQYAHTAGYLFDAVYYRGDYISPENQAVIDHLNAFPKDDPLAFYDECMKHVPYERYTVDRSGNRACSYWATGHYLGKGLADFLSPETYREMNRFTNVYEWERYSSGMDDDIEFGNIYDGI